MDWNTAQPQAAATRYIQTPYRGTRCRFYLLNRVHTAENPREPGKKAIMITWTTATSRETPASRLRCSKNRTSSRRNAGGRASQEKFESFAEVPGPRQLESDAAWLLWSRAARARGYNKWGAGGRDWRLLKKSRRWLPLRFVLYVVSPFQATPALPCRKKASQLLIKYNK